MDFCKEYWTLVSSLEWADQIHGGLKCFNFNHISEPSIIALKQDLNAICNGLIQNFNEKQKTEWFSKLTGVFAWKWLLGCKEFEFLQPLSHFNLNRFKDLNLNLCYEIIKSNNWTKYFCDFLQSFNMETYVKLVNHFLRGLLSLYDFPSTENDVKFFVEFTYQTLLSFSDIDSCKNTTRHPLVPIHQPTNVDKFAAGQGQKTLQLFVEILTKILENQKSNDDSFHADILLIITSLNLISAVFHNKIKYISTIDYAECKTLVFDGRDVWADSITEFEINDLELAEGLCFDGVEASDKNESLNSQNLRDILSRAIRSLSEFVRNNEGVISRRMEDMKEECKGYSVLDVYLQMLGDLYVNPEQLPIDSNLEERISESLEGFVELISDVLCDKQVRRSRDEFSTRKALLMMENKMVASDYKNSFMSSLKFDFTDEELRSKQIRCLQENLDIIDDVHSFYDVYKFVKLLQTLNASEKIIKESKKVILKAYVKLDWSVRDDIIHKLNMCDQSDKVSLVEDVEDLKKRWKSCVSRVSETDARTRSEMSNIVSLFLLVDMRFVFQNILREVVAKGNMTRVAAKILGQFPKTLTLRDNRSDFPIFYDTFLSTYSTAKDPRRHLFIMMEVLLSEGGWSSDLKKAHPKLSRIDLFTDFSLACIQPMIACRSKADLSLVSMYLRILAKLLPCQSRHRFVYYSSFVLLCKLLEDFHFDSSSSFSSTKRHKQNVGAGGDDGSVVSNGGGDDDSINYRFDRKCQLLWMLTTWSEVYQMHFANDSSLNALLIKELEKYSWWTQNHFVGSLLNSNEMIIPPSIREHLMKESCFTSSDNSRDLELAGNMKAASVCDLIDFVEVSDACLKRSLNDFDLKILSFVDDDDDDLYDAFMWKICQKFKLATSAEWMRIVILLIEVANRSETKDEESTELKKVLAVCQLVCDSLLLVKVLSKKSQDVTALQEIPWNRFSQYLRSFVELLLERTNLNEGYIEIVRLCGCVCSEIPSECLVDFMKHLLLRK